MATRSLKGPQQVQGFLATCALLLLPGITACRSAYVEADVQNASGQPISIVEVDYPSASFGTDALAAGAIYHYRFKVLGSGATKVSWTDAAHKDHSVPGPVLHEGETGDIKITVEESQAAWALHLQP